LVGKRHATVISGTTFVHIAQLIKNPLGGFSVTAQVAEEAGFPLLGYQCDKLIDHSRLGLSMQASRSPSRKLRFGVFEIDLFERELRRSGLRQKLGPQPFAFLLAILERPGDLITRDELRQRLWPEGTYVDYELGLKKCVNRVREILGDSADRPRFIETVPRRGYRFIAPVEEVGGFGTEPEAAAKSGPIRSRGLRDGGAGAVKMESSPEPARRGSIWRKLRVRRIFVASALILVLLGASRLLLQRHEPHGSPAKTGPAAEPVVLPLISLPGEQSMPAFSPDGSRVAFVSRSAAGKQDGIYVAVVGAQSLVRLTQSKADYSPAWSPDGRELAFLRDRNDEFLIEVVPALGGAEKTIYSGPRWQRGYDSGSGGLCFSTDGKLLAFSESNPANQGASIKVLSLQGSSTRLLTSPTAGFYDLRPSFSPRGDKLAYIRSAGSTCAQELFVVSAAGGKPHQLTFDRAQILGPPAWMPNGREIVFSSRRGGLPTLWRVAASGGTPERVPGAGPIAWYASVSTSGGELAYERVDEEQSLCRLGLKAETRARRSASILVSSNKTYNLLPQFSPDGRRIAFQTERSGYSEVWLCDSDGSKLVQLTNLRGTAGSPHWSADGRYVAFDYEAGQHSEIYVVEVATGQAHALAAFPDADAIGPSWSRNGQWLYFASRRGSKVYQLWKMAFKDGVARSAAVQVTKNGGFAAAESIDGTQLFYSKFYEQGIWAVPSEGGRERAVWTGPGPDYWSNWAVTKDGIYFLAPEGNLAPEIEFLDFRTGRISRIARLEKPSFYGLAVSPDGRSLVYSQWERNEHDIFIMQNFW
jgi:Tol biopolymer transport system component/DNA-binding winged helix-turn-helix (wHTH) protein